MRLVEGVENSPTATLVDGREIVVRVLPEQGEGYISVARRISDDAEQAAAIQAANRGLPLVAGRAIDVPWDLLRSEYRYLALRALFPGDRFVDGRWEHRPREALALNHSEGLWQVALWFTGKGENWQQLALLNGMPGPEIGDADVVRIPGSLLLPEFVPQREREDGLLLYSGEAEDGFATYRLRRGEALYSAVVIRFTGTVEPDDVLETADEIARFSGIANVRDIPVGFKVRIPYPLLATEFLPRQHPRRIAARLLAEEQRELGIASVRAPRSLDGVHVILDPGHGGADIGASQRGIWESDYVYDVACRVRRLLERQTAAKVHMTLNDPEHGCRIFDGGRIPRNRREVVLTNPPYRPAGGNSTKVSVNLRWYLANAVFRDLTGNHGVGEDKVVFLSLHADALHSSLRGGMVYIPGANYRRGTHSGSGSRPYNRFEEWKQAPKVTVTRNERLRDEVVSRKLAQAILDGYEQEKLTVHSNQPIRDHIVRTYGRRRSVWRGLPAVLRGNIVPAKVLVETVNINNREDARLLEDPDGRERIARAIVGGLRGFFAEAGAGPSVRRAGGADRNAH